MPAPGVRHSKLYLDLDPPVAISRCEAALALLPEDADVLANLARAHLKAGTIDKAMPLLTRAIAGGSGQAMNSMARAYAEGTGVAKDLATAVTWYRRAMEVGFAPAIDNLADAYADGLGVGEDHGKKVELLRIAAALGHPTSMNSLGIAYENGQGVSKDEALARDWYRKAADGGEAYGAQNLAWMLLQGRGGPVDVPAAIEMFRLGARLGASDSMITLGDLASGATPGGKLDPAEAKRWYLAAAEAGDPDGYVTLGLRYASGEGFERSYALAAEWYRKGGEAGSAWGWRNLAWLLDDGRVEGGDMVKGTAALRKAAEMGDSTAMIELGRRHALGLGVGFSNAEAANWYRRASEAGSGQGMTAYAEALLIGRGVDRDIPAALALFEKAGAEGYPKAHARLADFYALGHIVALDRAKASEYYEKAADKGDGQAKFDLAWRYLEGQYLPQSEKKALALFEEALAGGVPAARRQLAPLLLRGDAAQQRRGIELIRSAADTKEGWALAALAHPGERLASLLPSGEPEQWRARIEALNDVGVLLDVASALQTGKLARQDFGLATRYAEAIPDPIAVKQFEFGLMLDLNLGGAAIDQLLKFVATDAFARAAPERRSALLSIVNDRAIFSTTSDNYEEMLRLSELGMTVPTASVGQYLATSGATPEDKARGRAMLESARKAGSTVATRLLGDVIFKDAPSVAEVGPALALWQEASDRGDYIASRKLAFYWGEDVNPTYYGSDKRVEGAPTDLAKAFDYMRRAANVSDFDSMAMLAVMYLRGSGTERNEAEAMRLLRDAIHCGSNMARVIMARAFLDGVAVERDPQAALRWFRLAAELDDSHSAGVGAAWMARAAINGWGMAPDVTEARKWLARAVKDGSGPAAEWQKACGDKASLSCLRRQVGVVVGALAPPSLTPEPSMGFAEREAKLLQEAAIAQEQDGSSFAIYEAASNLKEHYLLHRRFDQLLPILVRDGLEEEARLARLYGGEANYFALIGSSCRWSQASKMARVADKPEAALFFAKVAVNRLQEARRQIADLDQDIRECFLDVHRDRYRALADLFMEMGRYAEAENVLAMLKDFENFTYLRGGDTTPGKALEMMPLDSRQQAGYAAMEQAVAGLYQAGSAEARLKELKRGGTLNEAQTAEWESAQTALRAARTAFAAQMEALKTSLAALDAAEDSEDSQGRVQRVAAVQPRLQGLVRQMGESTVALHAVVLPDRVHWLLTTPHFQKSIAIAVDKAELRKLVGEYRTSLTQQAPDIEDKAKALYKAMFAPVDVALGRLRAKRVMLSLDDSLRYLPFAGLHDGREWLVSRYAFTQFRSAEDVLMGGSEGDEWRIAGFGATQGGAGFEPLPAVARELQSIVREDAAGGANGVLPGIRRLDAAFNRDALRHAAESGYPVLHIASHFKLDPTNGAGSFLLLGDRTTLPLEEFGNGEFLFQGLDLLTLSACETALGGARNSGAEVDSIAVTAQKLGASAVLASLWSVSDDSTAELMQSFYTAKAGGADKAEALRQAQLKMIASDGGSKPAAARGTTLGGGTAPAQAAAGTAHPFYWAPFVLLGNGG